MSSTRLRILRSPGGCTSYVLLNEAEKAILLLDPLQEIVAQYQDLVAKSGFRVAGILETHTHADHLSGARELRKIYGAGTEAAAALGLSAVETPGHTQDSVCYRSDSLLFTGDTLFIGGSGRTDFPGSSAEDLFASLQKLRLFEPKLQILPGHDYSNQLFSTLELELASNPHLSAALSQDEFTRLKSEECVAISPMVKQILDYNLGKSETLPFGASGDDSLSQGSAMACAKVADIGEYAECSVQDFAEKLKNGAVAIDVREVEETAKARLTGVSLIPISDLVFAEREIRERTKDAGEIHFICRTGNVSKLAAATFSRLLGVKTYSVAGGVTGWRLAGLPVEKPQA